MRRPSAPILCVLVFCGFAASVAAQDAPVPPVAKKVHTERVLNGGVLVDDYAWLRERQNPEVKQYLQAENAYSDAVLAPLKPLQQTIYDEMLSHIQQTDDSVPYRQRGYLYYTRTVEGQQYAIHCRRKGSMSAPEEILLDPNTMEPGAKFMHVGEMAVSYDNNLLAYTTDTVGFRQYRLHIKDLRTGKVLRDTAERVTTLAWAADNKTLFYGTEDEQTKRWDLIHRHAVGTEEDTVVFDEKDERFDIGLEPARDGRYILLRDESHITAEWSYLRTDDPSGTWTVIEPRRDNVMYHVEEGGGLLYIKINDTGKTYRLVSAPVATPGKAHWKQLIASRPDVALGDYDVFRSFYAVTERANGLPLIRVISLKDGSSRKVSFPDAAYEVEAAENYEFDATAYRYNYESPISPKSVYDYSVATGESRLLKQTKVPGYDPKLYRVERVWAKAADGTRVPVTVAYRKSLFTKGKNPLFVYGYGSYGITIPDDFSATRLPMMDRGVVTAVAHIRGGGELGEPWHDGGKMMTKRNTFTDFIDSTEYLLQQGYGQRGRVAIEGASAGGLLMGAVTNMRPDLFQAVLCEVPFVDVMNTMLDATLPLTVGEYEEWGNPNEKKAFDYMLTYSPYDNVKAQAYPNILVRTSFDDSQVMYWEPSKYVARMRALKTDHNTLVFLVNMHGGHGGSSGRYDYLRDVAMDDAFVLDKIGTVH